MLLFAVPICFTTHLCDTLRSSAARQFQESDKLLLDLESGILTQGRPVETVPFHRTDNSRSGSVAAVHQCQVLRE